MLQVKADKNHGKFKPWIEANCQCSYRQAAKYMQIAKCAPQGTFDVGINAFLDAHAERRPVTPSNLPTFTQDDAEYALKIHARTASDFAGEAVARSPLTVLPTG